jgi:hypothetical protein
MMLKIIIIALRVSMHDYIYGSFFWYGSFVHIIRDNELAIFIELNLIGWIYTGQRRERQQQYEDDLVSEVSLPNHGGHGLVRLVAVWDAPSPPRQ